MNTDRLQNDDGNVANILPRNPMRRRTARRNSGGSLVEVLIVLVVILIGVFAVIQIFPIGFTSLKKSEARLRADRLARTATESLTVDSSSLPEAITFSFYNGAGIRETVTSEDPDNLGTYQGTAANKLYFSDLNKYRYISNEPIRVPLATAAGGAGFGNGVGSIHFLSFGPIYMNSTVGNPGNVPVTAADIALFNSYLKVTSEKLVGVVVDSTDGSGRRPASGFAGYLSGANSYVIDYGDENTAPAIAFASSSKNRVFTITYSYQDESTDPATVKSNTVDLTVPAGGPVWFDLGTNPIFARSENVVRGFVRLASGAAWSADDPYEYKLISANLSPSANLGVIAFNPAGANFSVSVPGGTKPFTALASYAVLDWHILRDDREVPVGNDGAGKVRTNLPGIRLKGDEFVDFTATGADRTQVYPGLYPQVPIYHPGDALPNSDVSPDIQVFNLSRVDDPITPGIETPGTPLVAGDLSQKGTLASPGPDANADYWINRAGRGGTYPSGTIFINTERVNPGSKVRILYKAQGDWAVAFQKAAKAYRLADDPTNPGRPVSNDAEVFSTDVRGTGFADDRIYFHRSELNKGMTAVFEIDTAAGTTRLPARQFTVQNPDGPYSYALASDVAPEIIGTGVTGWRVYGTVNGASLKTRVIWQDEQNGRNPWRISDLETFVTRQAQ